MRLARLAALPALALAACQPGPAHQVAGGDAANGKRLIVAYGCGACHLVPGVREARGLVGPPLLAWGRRGFIAGQLPNTPANLQRWVMDPRSVEPRTAMPDLGVSAADARDLAAYLFSLR